MASTLLLSGINLTRLFLYYPQKWTDPELKAVIEEERGEGFGAEKLSVVTGEKGRKVNCRGPLPRKQTALKNHAWLLLAYSSNILAVCCCSQITEVSNRQSNVPKRLLVYFARWVSDAYRTRTFTRSRGG